MILLDTCALLWLSHKQENLSKNILKKINESSIVYISSISAFEISLKYRSQKLILPTTPIEWFNTIIEYHNLSLIDINLEISIKATELPLIHKDPCDRFIIATAKVYSIPVITADEIFRKYDIQVLF